MSTVSATSNSTYDMWARIPSEDTNAPKAGDNFKLTDRRVPQNTGQAAMLPMSHIFQGAVQFDQDQRTRQLTAELNKKQTDQLTLTTTPNRNAGLAATTTATGKTSTARTDGTTTSLATTTNRRARFSQGSNTSYSNTQASASGYSTQGKWAKPVANTATRLGAILDVTA